MGIIELGMLGMLGRRHPSLTDMILCESFSKGSGRIAPDKSELWRGRWSRMRIRIDPSVEQTR
jgi:hypothetical protein